MGIKSKTLDQLESNLTNILAAAATEAARVEYDSYIALLSQAGTDAPTAVELENTIGVIAWTRTDVGAYTGTLAGAFTADKTICLGFPNDNSGTAILFKLGRASDDTVTLEALTEAGVAVDVFSDLAIEIRVYA